MALVRTPENLWTELEGSKAQLQKHLKDYLPDLERVAGSYYGGSRAPDEPENHWQEWLSLFLPMVVSGDPQCATSTDQIEWPPVRSKAIEFELNRWSRLTCLREDLERCFVDFAVRFAVGITTVEPIAGAHHTGDPSYMPIFTRLSPMDFRWDPTVRDPRKARWMSHRVVYDIDDLLALEGTAEGEGWNFTRLRDLKANQARGDDRVQDLDGAQQVERSQVAVWEVWARADNVDTANSRQDGYNGVWYTVCEDGESEMASSDWVRAPRDAFVRPQGPYSMLGGMKLGDLPVPLAPLVGVAPQAAWNNRISRACHIAVEKYQRGIATNSDKLAQALEDDEDLTVVAADGADIRQILQPWERGGLTPQMMLAKDDARQNLDRSSGLHEAARGNITGRATATEVDAASQASDTRFGLLVAKCRMFVADIFANAAYYFDLDSDVTMDIGPLPFEVQTPQGPSRYVKARGGHQKGSKWSALDHERLSLVIDPFSMRRTDDQTRMIRFEVFNSVIDRVATLGTQAIYIDWDTYLRMVSEATGVRDLERLLDTDMLYEVASMMMQMEEPVRAQTKPQSRFSWSASTVPSQPTRLSSGSRGGKSSQRLQPGERSARFAATAAV